MTRGGRRVAITGLGMVTPLGNDVASTWEAHLAGRSGVGGITSFDASGFPVRIGAEVKGFDPRQAIDDRRLLKFANSSHAFGLAAAEEALRDAGIRPEAATALRWGCAVGSGMMGVEFGELAELHRRCAADGQLHPDRLLTDGLAADPVAFCRSQTNNGLALLLRRFGIRGYATAVHTACASGGQALGTGLKLIRRGTVDWVLAGGFDSMLNPIGLAGFCLLGALSTDNETPERASRPFDITRNGFVLGEGAAFLVLEEWEAARRRGARIYAELAGDGNSLSSYRITDSHPSGDGPIQAMSQALADAEAEPDAVDYVNAHGTSTFMNDRSECAAVRAVFGPHALKIAVSSTKSVMGHLIAAAGAVEGAICALAIHHGIAPVNANLVELDPECDLDVVRGRSRAHRIRVAISNSFGFGGSNSCVVFRHPGDVPAEGRRSGGGYSSSPATTVPGMEAPATAAAGRRTAERGRIVVTGAGAVCAAGRDVEAIWETVCAGRSVIAPIQQWDASAWPTRLAAEVTGIDPRTLVEDRKLHKLIRRSDLFGLYAAGRAIQSAALLTYRESLDGAGAAALNDRTGVFAGSGGGAYQNQYEFFPLLSLAEGDLGTFGRELSTTVNPMWLLRNLPNNVLCHIGIRYDLKGTNACVTNHALGGTLAIVEAAAALRAGEADRAVAVGHDSPIEPETVLYYSRLGLLASGALRPFDAARDGSLFGEGAAALMLEDASAAVNRGAPVLGRFLGSGCTSEAQGLLAIRTDGEGLAQAITLALDEADVSAADVGMIVAHGNGTRQSDASEARAIARVFGAASPPVTAFKWAFGHLIAASGPLETVLALAALRRGVVPGVATLRTLDPDLGPLPVSREPQSPRSDIGLVLSRGFGGINVAILVQACGE